MNLSDVAIVVQSRADAGPMASVVAAMPEAHVYENSVGWGHPSRDMSSALGYFYGEFTKHKPKLMILVGDRYETLAAALSALFERIPILHVHGGEITNGSFDNELRDAISAVSTYHFTATPRARARLSIMGYTPVLCCGAPGLDSITPNTAKRDRAVIVVSFYPETHSDDYGLANCNAMLDALEPYTKDHAIFFSSMNTDPGSDIIGARLDAFISEHPMSASLISPPTREQYLHLLEHAKVVAGNSSSGHIEAPWIGIPTWDVGNRQDGRERANSVFSTLEEAMAFTGTVKPVYKGGAAAKIREFIEGL